MLEIEAEEEEVEEEGGLLLAGVVFRLCTSGVIVLSVDKGFFLTEVDGGESDSVYYVNFMLI